MEMKSEDCGDVNGDEKADGIRRQRCARGLTPAIECDGFRSLRHMFIGDGAKLDYC